MWNELVGQYLKSADGNDLLKQLQTKGLTEQQATQSVTATAEAASSAPASGLNLSSIAGGLLGGAAPGGSGMANSIAQVVAQKTGLALPMAQTVVSMVLPKVMSLFSGAQPNATQAPSPVKGILGGLFR